MEVGFGGGEHALAQIAANPRAGLIASEVFENGLCSLLSRLVPEGGEERRRCRRNLLLWDADARRLLATLPDASLDRVFLLFPDPWPKARHAKRRFVHPALLPAVARVLKPGPNGASPRRPDYQAWVADMFSDRGVRARRPAERPGGWPPTRYEAKALRKAGHRSTGPRDDAEQTVPAGFIRVQILSRQFAPWRAATSAWRTGASRFGRALLKMAAPAV